MRSVAKRVAVLERCRSRGVEVTPKAREIMTLRDRLPRVSPVEEKQRIVHQMALDLTDAYRQYTTAMS